MTNQAHMWPEGETFTREVMISTEYEPFPVMITFVVPSFKAVVDIWQNKD